MILIGKHKTISSNLLNSLVPFTCNQNYIVRTRLFNRCQYCKSTIYYSCDLRFFILINTLYYLLNNTLWIFRSRIVTSYNYAIRYFTGNLSHQRALTDITITTTSENRDDAARTQCANRLQRIDDAVREARRDQPADGCLREPGFSLTCSG